MTRDLKPTPPLSRRVFPIVSALFWWTLALFAITGFGFFVFTRFEDPSVLAARFEEIKPYLQVWRLLLIAAMVAFWGPLSRLIGHLYRLDADTVTALEDLRWTLAVFLLLAELIVVQRLPFVLLQHLGS